jgi:hypothetical protein
MLSENLLSNKNSSTIRILRVIGSPFIAPCYTPENESEAEILYESAAKNRIAQLYLDALKDEKMSETLKKERQRLTQRYDNLLSSIESISNLLTDLKVDYVIFKTVRPYLAATADIDLVVFGRKYILSIEAMLKAGYKTGDNTYGPESATLFDAKWNIKLDIYDEIAASHLIYLDKEKIRQYVKRDKILSGAFFMTLKPQADLVAVIGHSVIKEQMYCLGEYYTFLYYLYSMKEEEIVQFIDMVKKNGLTNSAKAYISVTATLHQAAHGVVPNICLRLMSDLGSDFFEGARIENSGFLSPHKYHFLTVVKAMKDLLKENKFKRSIGTQMMSFLEPDFTSEFINEIVQHLLRDTY